MAGKCPNILWIMTDQHRADYLGFMGHPFVQTPHLDRLAESGVVFENAFCQSPVCMASRASLFTGRYPETVCMRGGAVLPPRETTTPEVFRRNGYRTGAFGKVHLTPEVFTKRVLKRDVPTLDLRHFAEAAKLGPIPDDPFKRNYGFEEHVGCEDRLQGLFEEWVARQRPDLLNQPKTPCPGGPRDCFVSPFPSALHQSTFIASQAESFIRRNANSAPWFAFCSFIAPHHPFEAPSDQIARYDFAQIPPPDAEKPDRPDLVPEPACGAFGEMATWNEEIRRRIVLHYCASISLIDDNVGRLVKALEDTGQMEDTIVLFVADHGEFLGRHSLIRKPSIHYDETLRVPLMLRLPGNGSGGRRVKGLVELVDVHPTLLGLAGLEANPGCQGRDWSRMIATGDPIGRPDICSDFKRRDTSLLPRDGPYMACQTLRTERWKLNIYPTASPAFGQLFDLNADPGERNNLYDSPSHKGDKEEMLWRLAARIAMIADPLPLSLSQY